MSNITKNSTYFPVGKGGRDWTVGVDGGTHLYEGGLVSQLTATGMAVPTTTAASGPALGMNTFEVDNSAGADDAKKCRVHTDRVFSLANGTSGDAFSVASLLGAPAYAIDDNSVADNDAGGTRPLAGMFVGFADDGRVNVLVGPIALAMLGAATLSGVASQAGSVNLSLYDLREVTSGGDVGNIAANGGLLASDTTPILRGDANDSQEVSWATGNADVVAFSRTLPPDFDGTGDVTLELYVSSGTTNAATFTVESSWDAGAVVSDSASDAATKSATVHKITATIAAADIPDTASFVTVLLTPAAHATDTIQLHAARLLYVRAG